MKQNQNNFDFLRLFFSSLVIFSHSFPLTGQDEIAEKYTNGQISLGGLAVDVFFIMSGYLIFISLKTSSSILDYFWKRCLRLFPALFVMLLITLIVAIVVYTGDNIFRQRDFYTYLPANMLLYNIRYMIGGVFVDNPYPRAINGSLWSLYYEFIMYILVAAFFPFRNKKKLVLTVLAAIYLFASLASIFDTSFLSTKFGIFNIDAKQFYRLTNCFFAGALLSQLNIKWLNSSLTWIITLVVLIISVLLGVFPVISIIVMPVFIISFGLSFFNWLSVLPRAIGDISYGVYIYGFLVQQTLMNYFDMNPYVLTLFSILITYIFAYFSWHAIEKPAMKFKKLFSRPSLKVAKGLP